MEVNLIKTLSGFVPAEQNTKKWYDKIKPGEVVRSDFKKVRNYGFLKKYFALLNVGFDNWEPGEVTSKHGKPEKNFDRFREDIAILCGFYSIVIRLDRSTKVEAKSISFGSMSQEEFEGLYSKTIDLFIKRIYGKDMDKEKLNKIVEGYLNFA